MSGDETDEKHIRHGLDTRKPKDVQVFAKENPTEVGFGFEANGVYEGRAVHRRATAGPCTLGCQRIERMARSYTHHFGAHKEVEHAVGFIDQEAVDEDISYLRTSVLRSAVFNLITLPHRAITQIRVAGNIGRSAA